MNVPRTIGLSLLWLAATTPICLSGLFLGGRLLIREINRIDGGRAGSHTFTIPESSLVWYEKDRELLVDGRMFDVGRLERKNGLVTVTGEFDDLETELNRALEETDGTGSPGSDSGWRLFQSCLGITGIPTTTPSMEKGPQPREGNPLSPHTSYPLSNGHRTILIPPPQAGA